MPPDPPNPTTAELEGPHDAGLFVSAYPHLAEVVFNRPLLVQQAAMDAVLHALAPRMGFAVQGAMPAAQGRRPDAAVLGLPGARQADGGYTVMPDGTAIVTVTGKLANRASWLDAESGMTSYTRVERRLADALADADVRRVVLEVDSPGGTVAGAFDFAERLYDSRGLKPIIAAPCELAASAAYLIAAAADEIVLPETGSVGSIGVVIALLNREKAMAKAGLAMTYIHAGAKKVDGNPYQALPDRVRAELQDEVDETYALFVNRVAKYRRLAPDAIRATEAGMFSGRRAVDAGLADRLDSFNHVVQNPRRAAATPGSRSSLFQSTEIPMTDAEKAAADQAVADATTRARADGHAAGLKDGVTTERARIKAITGHEHARGREASAAHLAFETDMAADAAVALLATMPKAAAPAPAPQRSALERAMAATGGGPGIGLDAGATEPTPAPRLPDADAIYASRRASH